MKWDISIVERAGSSQDEAKRDLREGRVVRVLEQTAGRGRHGREWLSFPGNLFFSYVIKPARPMAEWGSLSLLAGLALVEAIDDPRAVLKWPNDVMIDGAKAAGILVEVEGDAVVVGIGVNLHSAPPEGTAISQNFDDEETGADDLLERFLECFASRYDGWLHNGFSEARRDWTARSYEIGAAMSVKLPSGRIDGQFSGVDETGALLLDEGNGAIRTIVTGDIL